jgi:arylsulfatase A-like enzyme/lipopolysaccharide biosynthesis regulator YciM
LNSTNRKRILLAVFGAAFVWLAGAEIFRRRASPPAPAPGLEDWRLELEAVAPQGLNVVLVTIDTLRADRLSSYGSRFVETPHMDALAREGVRFSAAASTVPFTLPAHSSIMTGTYPPLHGVRENVGHVLDDRLPTLAERLAAGGWTTAGFVSAFVLDSRWGIARGFETYFDRFDLGEKPEANLGAVQRDGRETLDETIRWLDEIPEKPFFLWLHLFDPHDPYTPSEPFKSRYPRNPYDAEVAYVDSLVGELRGALEARDLLDSSLVVLTGDHGEGLGQHKEGFHGFFVYESTIRVPLILRFPAGRFAGREVGAAVSHVDLLPTVLEVTGLSIPERAQGSSLMPLIVESEQATGEERAVLSESLYPLLHYGWAPLRSLRTARYKFIEAPEPELYDLIADPQETRNLLREDRRTARELRDRLLELREEIEEDAPEIGERAELDDETLDRLQALGYVAGRGGVDAGEETTGTRADPKDRIELHQLVMAAQSDIGGGDLDRAESRLERALAIDSSVVEAHQMLGTIALERRDLEAAVERFQAALALDSELESAILGLARAYHGMERLDEAMTGYRRLAELDPESLPARMGIVDLHLARGRTGQAIEELESASQLRNPPAAALNRLGELLVESGRAEEAGAHLRRAVERNPKLSQGWFNLAVLAEERGSVGEAIELYETAIAASPGHFQAQFNLGRLYGARGEIERQRRLYEAALASNPEFVRGYYFLAKLLMDSGGDLARAEALARTGLEKDPAGQAGPLGYYVLADLLHRRGRRDEAAAAAAAGRRLQAGGGVEQR